MVYILIACNIVLSLFIVLVVIDICYNVNFFGRVFHRSPNKIRLATVAFLCFFCCIALVITTDTMWKNNYWVSVDAVVTDSKVQITQETRTIDGEIIYYDDKSYQITYTFDYNGETHQTARSSENDIAIGTIENIKIDPNNPENSGLFVCMLPVIILVMGVVFNIFMSLFKKS